MEEYLEKNKDMIFDDKNGGLDPNDPVMLKEKEERMQLNQNYLDQKGKYWKYGTKPIYGKVGLDGYYEGLNLKGERKWEDYGVDGKYVWFKDNFNYVAKKNGWNRFDKQGKRIPVHFCGLIRHGERRDFATGYQWDGDSSEEDLDPPLSHKGIE